MGLHDYRREDPKQEWGYLRKFQVTIDVGSLYVIVEAEDIEEAEKIVTDQINNGEHLPADMWVAKNETKEIEE